MPPRKKAKAADDHPADVAEALKPVEMTSAELRRALRQGSRQAATARPALVKMLQEALDAGLAHPPRPSISQSEAPPRDTGGRGGGRGRAEAGPRQGPRQGPRRRRVDGDGDGRRGESPARGETDDDAPAPAFAPGFPTTPPPRARIDPRPSPSPSRATRPTGSTGAPR